MVMVELSACLPEAPVSATPGSSPGVLLPRDLITLRAAFGQDEANHDTTRYPVDHEGLVRVPLEAVAFLIGTGGFAMPKTTEGKLSIGKVKLHHEDAAGCSYAGRQYRTDEKGDVLVPAEAAADLLAHGFAAVLQQAKLIPGKPKPLSAKRPAKV
jgi:hypothetical protein